MGLLLFAGMMATWIYGGHSIKKEAEAIYSDNKIKTSINTVENEKNIRNNFEMICKRSGIKMSKDGTPINIQQCHKGMEYLQYQGFNEKSVEYFKKLYESKYNEGVDMNKRKIQRKHKKMLEKLRNQPKRKLIVFRKEYYGNENPKNRMERIMENELWNEMTEHYTYIRGHGVASFCEVWTLFVPNDFFSNDALDKKKNKLYKEICWIEEIDDGRF